MFKFSLVSRRKPEDSIEKFHYEWGIIHVALMISTPDVMRTFHKYAQHYRVPSITNDMLNHPLSEMDWNNMSNHWVRDDAGLMDAVKASDYVIRMQPHKFGDHNFVLALVDEEVVYAPEPVKKGGVKLVQFFNPKKGLSDDEFLARWKNGHAKTVIDVAGNGGPLKQYTQNIRRPLDDPKLFEGSLFARGDMNHYIGFDEYWFDTIDDLASFRKDPKINSAITASEAYLIDPDDCFSFASTERVIYDYTLGENSSPIAAVLQPGTLEAQVYEQGLGDWHIPNCLKD